MQAENNPSFVVEGRTDVYISGRELIKNGEPTGYSVVDGKLLGPEGDTGYTVSGADIYAPGFHRCGRFWNRWIVDATDRLPAVLRERKPD